MTITIQVQNWKHINFCDVLQQVITALKKCNDEGTLERGKKYSYNDYNQSGVECTIKCKL